MNLKQRNRIDDVTIKEFKVLVNNLILKTQKQAEWICNQFERLTNKHPELKEKSKEWSQMPKSEREELEAIINHILSKSDLKSQKNSESYEKNCKLLTP